MSKLTIICNLDEPVISGCDYYYPEGQLIPRIIVSGCKCIYDDLINRDLSLATNSSNVISFFVSRIYDDHIGKIESSNHSMEIKLTLNEKESTHALDRDGCLTEWPFGVLELWYWESTK